MIKTVSTGGTFRAAGEVEERVEQVAGVKVVVRPQKRATQFSVPLRMLIVEHLSYSPGKIVHRKGFHDEFLNP
jgi:hypothetical protein